MITRWAERKVLDALDFIDITAVVGARQVGKTTLCQAIAKKRGFPFLSMDNPKHFGFATEDPLGFIETYPKAFIDEIQRAPELILPLKYSVDQNRFPGRYLMSGSVDLFRSSVAPDSLAGRMEMVELSPFAHREIYGLDPSSLITEAFEGHISSGTFKHFASEDIASLLSQGGYPIPVLGHYDGEQRMRWLCAHIDLVSERDLSSLEEVRKKDSFRDFITYLSDHPAQLMNISTCAAALSVSAHSIQRWLDLLEQLFLTQRVPSFHKSHKKSLSKMPKCHFIDTGILLAVGDHNTESLLQKSSYLGNCFENYIFTELTKLISILEERISLYHYRDHNKKEVDFVLKKGRKLVGVEVKATNHVMSHHFKGLRHFKKVCGDDFVCGMVLYPGKDLEQRDKDLFAVPLGKLL